jgi:ankyrin repeat protein
MAPELEATGGQQTPLRYAAKFGAYFAVRRLLEAGADVNVRGDEGHSALDVAKEYAHRVSELADEEWVEVPGAVRSFMMR